MLRVTWEHSCNIIKSLFWWLSRTVIPPRCYSEGTICSPLLSFALQTPCCNRPAAYFQHLLRWTHIFCRLRVRIQLWICVIPHEEGITQIALRPTYLRHPSTVPVARLPQSLQSTKTRQGHSPEMLPSTSNITTTVVIDYLREARMPWKLKMNFMFEPLVWI